MQKLRSQCLIDSNTGEPLELDFPDGFSENEIEEIRIKAWECGTRFRLGLSQGGDEDFLATAI